MEVDFLLVVSALTVRLIVGVYYSMDASSFK